MTYWPVVGLQLFGVCGKMQYSSEQNIVAAHDRYRMRHGMGSSVMFGCIVRKCISGLAVAAIVSTAASQVLIAQNRFISIGTGGSTGVYYVVGSTVCRMLHKYAKRLPKEGMEAQASPSLKCSAPTTGGSIYNLNNVRTGDLNLGVVQSDWHHHAFHGTSIFEGKQIKNLRSVFSVHAEPFQIVVGKTSGISSWKDLKGKRVNIGNPGSGQRSTFEVLMIAHDIDASFFGSVTELESSKQSQALCENLIDAFGYTVGVPNAGVAQAADGCGAHIIDLDTEPVAKLVSENPYYITTTIPQDMYTTTDHDVTTFGVVATVVASSEQSEETIYQVVRAVFEQLNEFKKAHPAFARLTPQEMISRGLAAPLHPGARKYYVEQGWLKAQ